MRGVAGAAPPLKGSAETAPARWQGNAFPSGNERRDALFTGKGLVVRRAIDLASVDGLTFRHRRQGSALDSAPAHSRLPFNSA